MKNGSKTGLEINNPVSTQIFGLFVGDALQRLFCLHHCDGVREALQIFCKTPLIRSAKEPLRKCLWGIGWELRVVCVSRQLNDSLRPQHTVQMLVQKDFGKALH